MSRALRMLISVLLAVFASISFPAVTRAVPGVDTQAKAMTLMELETGSIIAEENSDLKLPMASTTKIMTALVVLENCDVNEEFLIPDEAVGVEGSSINLEKGESMKVIDLLYGLMLASGNDAAVALAVHTSGSVSSFADKMNERALSLGLKDTHFITPNGLHDERHITTAYELCVIAREALKNETFSRIASTKYYTTESGSRQRTFKNKNALLWDYEGAFGVKNGYTMAAGRCLVFGAERNGIKVVGVLLNCRPMFETAEKLLDHVFDNYSMVEVVGTNATVLKTFVENNSESLLEVETKDSIMILMQRSAGSSLRAIPVLNEDLSAPVYEGETVGTLYVYDGDALMGSTELIASNSVPADSFQYWWETMIRGFLSNEP